MTVALLFPLGKNKITITNFEANLKQVLLNTDQNNRHLPNLYLGFPEYGAKLHQSVNV